MSQFIEPPPLNTPIVSDTTGVIRSTPWVLWLNSLADAIASGVLSDVNAVQSTIPAESMTSRVDFVSDTAMYNFDSQSMTTTEADGVFPFSFDSQSSTSSFATVDDISTLFWTSQGV